MMHRSFVLIAACSLLSWTTSAFATDPAVKAKARNLVNSGVAEFERGQFEAASSKFQEAQTLVEAPTIAVWSARSQEKLGRLVEAAKLYKLALEMQPNDLWVGQVQQGAQKEAKEALPGLESRIAHVRLALNGGVGANVEVTLDKVTIPNDALGLEQQLNPGAHTIAVRRAGELVSEEALTLAEGERRVVTLKLPVEAPAARTGAGDREQPTVALRNLGVRPVSAPDASSKEPLRTLTWVSFGVGAAGITLGTIAGITTGRKHSDLRDSGCNDTTCWGNQFDSRVDSYNRWRTISIAGLVAGGVGVAAGVTLLLLQPEREAAPSVSLTLRSDNVALTGGF